MTEQDFLKIFMVDSDIFKEECIIHITKSELIKIYKEYFNNMDISDINDVTQSLFFEFDSSKIDWW